MKKIMLIAVLLCNSIAHSIPLMGISMSLLHRAGFKDNPFARSATGSTKQLEKSLKFSKNAYKQRSKVADERIKKLENSLGQQSRKTAKKRSGLPAVGDERVGASFNRAYDFKRIVGKAVLKWKSGYAHSVLALSFLSTVGFLVCYLGLEKERREIERRQREAEKRRVAIERHNKQWDSFLVRDPELLKAYKIICNALQVDQIPLYRSQKEDATEVAHYDPTAKRICLFPGFYRKNAAWQVGTLIHELRHHMQYTQKLEISQDVIDFIEKYDFQGLLEENLSKQLYLGFDYTVMGETDADTFAYRQFTCPRCVKNAAGYSSENLRAYGYVRGADVKSIVRSMPKKEYCRAHNNSFKKGKKKAGIIDYVPEEMKRRSVEVEEQKRRIAEAEARNKRIELLIAQALSMDDNCLMKESQVGAR